MEVVWLLELFVSVGLVHPGPLSVGFHGPNRYHPYHRICGPYGRVPERAPDWTHPHWNFYSFWMLLLCFSHNVLVSFKDVAIMWWQSLKPQLKLIVLRYNDLEFVRITSISEGVWFFRETSWLFHNVIQAKSVTDIAKWLRFFTSQ